MKRGDNGNLSRKKRIFAIISASVVLLLVGFLTYFAGVRFNSVASSGIEFKDYVKSFGNYGFIVAIGIQIVQVIIALIPGEIVEIGIGYAYGWFWGTLMCLIGIAIGSAIIFMLVKKFGVRFVELFVSSDKINEMRFINSEKKLRRFTFAVYFIPGTPKDLLTFFVGLTRMPLKEFLALTLFARIPSIVSSTLGGSFIGDKHYWGAVVVFVVTALVSFLGMKIYSALIVRIKKRAERNKKSDKAFHRHGENIK